MQGLSTKCFCAIASPLVLLGTLTVLGGASLLPLRAEAHVPRAERVINAVAESNVKGRRVRALRYRLKLHIGDGPPVAAGDLVTHPTGLARLELRASGGLIERHILLGDQHSAARNARLLVRPRAFLPPLFVLQSNSGAVLRAALKTLGIDRELVGLAPCGESDCYVIGDPTRAVRRPLVRVVVDEDEDVDGDLDGENEVVIEGVADEAGSKPEPEDKPAKSREASEEQGPAEDQYFATLWVDTVKHQVRRIESRDGVRVVLGPYVSFEHLKAPLWWSIEEPGKRPVRFEVDSVVEVNAPAAAFSKTWLMAPVTGPTPEEPAEEPTEEAPASDPEPPLPPNL